MSPDDPPPSGLLNVDKPPGITSRGVVNRVLRAFPAPKPKVGHAGTLDPLASGVLVLAVGSGTRLIEYVQAQQKTYVASILLGSTSDTLDADGTVSAVPDAPIPAEQQVRDALATQVGTIEQMPPAFSALRVDGKRAYDLAREGKAVELAPRSVRIDRVSLVRYEWPNLEIEVDCGSGTYIRSIARDVGELLGCGGLITVLRRTRIGPFRAEDAVPIDDENLAPDRLLGRLRPILDALVDLPRLTLDADQCRVIRLGQSLPASETIPRPTEPGEVALLSPDGGLLAIANADLNAGRYRPKRVFAGPEPTAPPEPTVPPEPVAPPEPIAPTEPIALPEPTAIDPTPDPNSVNISPPKDELEA